MFEKLAGIEVRYQKVLEELSDPAVASDRKRFKELGQEQRQLEPLVEEFRKNVAWKAELDDARRLLDEPDADMRQMARDEIQRLEGELAESEARLKVLLLPKDPNDEKDVIVEIRAGTGGDEAALFAGDVLRMYMRYAEARRWKVDLMSNAETELGGTREAILSISGQNVYSRLKFESGVHRVQRVPETEAQGRIHTSACTVAVLPEADEVEIDIAEKDLRIDVYRSSGPGGQSVNTTDSAVRITHLATGLVVQCQDEKSQLKNKAKALKILRARLYEKIQGEADALRAADRKAQVGSGDRSERIRTYNFPQNRLTDHRIGLTLYKLDQIVMGNLDEVFDSLSSHFQAEALKGEA